MPSISTPMSDQAASFNRRDAIKWAATATAAANLTIAGMAQAAGSSDPSRPSSEYTAAPLTKRHIGFMLAHEEFTVPQLVDIGARASQAGFGLLATSDHFQPWQANQGHAGQAWVTLAATGARAQHSWMGTTVTCPILRYNPAIVAEGFASLAMLYPGRIFLGVGSGEALNETAATGAWPAWKERWERLIEALGIIRGLWSGQPLDHEGKYYTVNARLYDTPRQPIPLLTAANGPQAMRLAGIHGDGLVTDPKTWKEHKSEWEKGAHEANKNPADMPVLIEQYVVVGGQAEAEQAANLWRFGPKAFKGYHNIRDPADIQRHADSEIPLNQVMEGWPIGMDAGAHEKKITELLNSGATIVNIHAGQKEQNKVIDFYGEKVLPRFK